MINPELLQNILANLSGLGSQNDQGSSATPPASADSFASQFQAQPGMNWDHFERLTRENSQLSAKNVVLEHAAKSAPANRIIDLYQQNRERGYGSSLGTWLCVIAVSVLAGVVLAVGVHSYAKR